MLEWKWFIFFLARVFPFLSKKELKDSNNQKKTIMISSNMIFCVLYRIKNMIQLSFSKFHSNHMIHP